MWNEITQANYDRSDQRYASNLSDGEPESLVYREVWKFA